MRIAVVSDRRVSYDVEREARQLVNSGFPYAAWMAEILSKASYVNPPEQT